MINDTFGHSVGEQVMIKSAKILEKSVRGMLRYLKGRRRRFVVVLPHAKNNEQIEECAENCLILFLILY
jgi:GGDEF domain-containing protein